MKLLSRQNRCPSLALMLHLTPDCWWWLWNLALDLEFDLEWYTWWSPWTEWQLSSLISHEILGQRLNAAEIHNERVICPYTFPLITLCGTISIPLDLWTKFLTYSVMFKSIETSSSRLNCMTRKGYLVWPCRRGGSRPIEMRVWSSSGFGRTMNFLMCSYWIL